jgi:RNA polymerase sigma-70 factor, ECF subfamily
VSESRTPETPDAATFAEESAAAAPGSARSEASLEQAGELSWTPPTWEQVVQEHSARVYRLAYRLTGNRHDAEDLTQEVFVRVFRSLSSYTPGTF